MQDVASKRWRFYSKTCGPYLTDVGKEHTKSPKWELERSGHQKPVHTKSNRVGMTTRHSNRMGSDVNDGQQDLPQRGAVRILLGILVVSDSIKRL